MRTIILVISVVLALGGTPAIGFCIEQLARYKPYKPRLIDQQWFLFISIFCLFLCMMGVVLMAAMIWNGEINSNHLYQPVPEQLYRRVGP